MSNWLTHLKIWWDALVHPAKAGDLVMTRETTPGFYVFLTIEVVAMYAIYGLSMGLFRGVFPGFVSSVKMPFLFVASLLICFPAFYVCNCYTELRLTIGQCLRLLLLAVSANAIALCSYAPLSFFFTLTTSRNGYEFLVFMHVLVFALAGLASICVIVLVFRSTAARAGKRIRPLMVAVWGIIYAFVGTEMAWVLRPWIGWWEIDYAPFRPLQESFVESLLRVTRLLFWN